MKEAKRRKKAPTRPQSRGPYESSVRPMTNAETLVNAAPTVNIMFNFKSWSVHLETKPSV